MTQTSRVGEHTHSLDSTVERGGGGGRGGREGGGGEGVLVGGSGDGDSGW